MHLVTALKKIKKSLDTYQPLITVKISRSALLHNLRQFQIAYPGVQFAPVLKSNAYGHGLTEVASVLDKERLPFFMVDSLFEAKQLRRSGIATSLLILGYTTAGNINFQKLRNVAFGILSLDQLQKLNEELRRQTVFHLKIDTGMRRQGLLPEQLGKALSIIKNNRLIKIEGICSHLADADGESENFSTSQIALWNNVAQRLKRELGSIRFCHLANTAGTGFAGRIDANVSRLGLGLYGFNASPRRQLNLQPILSMDSIISSLKPLKQGEKIGYNGIFTAPQDMLVATVPVGYAEGLDRRLSNCGAMTVNGVTCPIVGRVSMNMASIDVTAAAAALETPVSVMSSKSSDINCIERMAELCQTIPYDIIIGIPAHLKRIIT